MKKYIRLAEDGTICLTADSGTIIDGKMTGTQFDFPDDFDFSRQHYYRIINGVLVENTELLSRETAAEIRRQRDALLRECDWTQMPDSPLEADIKAAWADYRQALRDIPQQEEFPYSVDFPAKP